jgi:hypothetical protein
MSDLEGCGDELEDACTEVLRIEPEATLFGDDGMNMETLELLLIFKVNWIDRLIIGRIVRAENFQEDATVWVVSICCFVTPQLTRLMFPIT